MLRLRAEPTRDRSRPPLPLLTPFFLSRSLRADAHAKPGSNRAKGARTRPSDCCGVCAALQADDAREAAGLARKRRKGEEGDAEPTYAGWSTAKWNELETKLLMRETYLLAHIPAAHEEQRGMQTPKDLIWREHLLHACSCSCCS